MKCPHCNEIIFEGYDTNKVLPTHSYFDSDLDTKQGVKNVIKSLSEKLEKADTVIRYLLEETRMIKSHLLSKKGEVTPDLIFS